jgi:hypothetical protein
VRIRIRAKMSWIPKTGGKVFSALHCMKTFKAIHFLQILVQYYRYGDAVNLLQPLYMAALNVGENSGQNSSTFF